MAKMSREEVEQALLRDPGVPTERYGGRFGSDQRFGVNAAARAAVSEQEAAAARLEYVPLGMVERIFLDRRIVDFRHKGPMLTERFWIDERDQQRHRQILIATPVLKLAPQPVFVRGETQMVAKNITSFATHTWEDQYVMQPLTQIQFTSTMETGSHQRLANFMIGPKGEVSMLLYKPQTGFFSIWTPAQIAPPGYWLA